MNIRSNRFGDREFIDEELAQIVTLIIRFLTEDDTAISKSKFSPLVLEYAERSRLIIKRPGRMGQPTRLRLVASSAVFDIKRDVPVGALWILFRRYILPEEQKSVGHSITKSKGWEYLKIRYEGQPGFNLDDEAEMIEVLHGFMMFGLIWFQHAGSIWDISVRDLEKERAAMRGEAAS
jgi:hypothetical protein